MSGRRVLACVLLATGMAVLPACGDDASSPRPEAVLAGISTQAQAEKALDTYYGKQASVGPTKATCIIGSLKTQGVDLVAYATRLAGNGASAGALEPAQAQALATAVASCK